MKLSPAIKAAVMVMTLLFALFLIFSVFALITLFYPRGISFGEEYFDMLLTQYLGSLVFSAIGLTAGTIVLYKFKER
jgi:hypothetical protein